MGRNISIYLLASLTMLTGCSFTEEEHTDGEPQSSLQEAEQLLDRHISLAQQSVNQDELIELDDLAAVDPEQKDLFPEGVDIAPEAETEDEMAPDDAEEMVPEEAPEVKVVAPTQTEEKIVEETKPNEGESTFEAVKSETDNMVAPKESEIEASATQVTGPTAARVLSDYIWSQGKDFFRKFDLELQQVTVNIDVTEEGTLITLCFVSKTLMNDESARMVLVDALEELIAKINVQPALADQLPRGSIRGRQFHVSIDFDMNLGRYFEMIFCDRLILKNGCVSYYDFEGKLMHREAYEKAKMLVELEHEINPFYKKGASRIL